MMQVVAPTLSLPPLRGEDEGGGRGFRGNIPLNILVVAG